MRTLQTSVNSNMASAAADNTVIKKEPRNKTFEIYRWVKKKIILQINNKVN